MPTKRNKRISTHKLINAMQHIKEVISITTLFQSISMKFELKNNEFLNSSIYINYINKIK